MKFNFNIIIHSRLVYNDVVREEVWECSRDGGGAGAAGMEEGLITAREGGGADNAWCSRG